ncbi:MAG: cyclically-permuted mutarotase family protein, partial [Prevotella pleuritidis]|nr:cyclically-permuted mutarotase family protein [Hoylesella pleuritidis]
MKGLLLLVFALLMGIESNAEELFSVRRVYGFPAGERGIEQGVSACFAGAIGHRLL